MHTPARVVVPEVAQIELRNQGKRLYRENHHKITTMVYAGKEWDLGMLSLQHPNRNDLYFVIGLLAMVAVNVFFLMRRK